MCIRDRPRSSRVQFSLEGFGNRNSTPRVWRKK